MPDLSIAAAGGSNLPIAAGLIGIAVAAVAYVAILPLFGDERRASKRLKSIGVSASGAAIRGSEWADGARSIERRPRGIRPHVVSRRPERLPA